MNQDETTPKRAFPTTPAIARILYTQASSAPLISNQRALQKYSSKDITRWGYPRSPLSKGWFAVAHPSRRLISDAAFEAMQLFKKHGLTVPMITEYEQKRKNGFYETITEGFVHVTGKQGARFNYLDLHVLYFLVTDKVYQHGQTASELLQIWDQKITPHAALDRMMHADTAWWEAMDKQCQPTVQTAHASDAQPVTRPKRSYAQVLQVGLFKTGQQAWGQQVEEEYRALSTHIDAKDLEEDGWEIVESGCLG